MKDMTKLILLMLVLASGCAKDGLKDLHLTSTEEISQKKRELTAQAHAQASADEIPSPAAAAAEPVVPAADPSVP